MTKIQAYSNHFIILLAICFGIGLHSCKTPEHIIYFEDARDSTAVVLPDTKFTPVIKPDDVISIFVSAPNMDLARPFNQSQGLSVEEGDGDTEGGGGSSPTFVVDADGKIDFPVLGTIQVGGKTRNQVSDDLEQKLTTYINDPIVHVRITNFKITVLGEVRSPGVFNIPNERVTILEALGLAGDLTIQGERTNVKVMREENNKVTYTEVDLTSKEIHKSSVYYLAQNDILYVTPNESRIKQSKIRDNTTLGIILSVVGTAITVISLVIAGQN